MANGMCDICFCAGDKPRTYTTMLYTSVLAMPTFYSLPCLPKSVSFIASCFTAIPRATGGKACRSHIEIRWVSPNTQHF